MKQKLLNIANGALGKRNYWQIRQVVNREGKICSSNVECLHYEKKKGRDAENNRYLRAIKGMGICLECGELDFRVLCNHHIFGKKYSDIKITLCANCHQRLHWERGRRW